MITVVTHPAERCQNELAYVKASWYSPDRFNVIKKWMAVYYWRVKDGQYTEPERPRDV